MLEIEGFNLLDALIASSERSIIAYQELEHQIESNLLNSGYWIEEGDFKSGINSISLKAIARKTDIQKIYVINPNGNLVASNVAHEAKPNFSHDETIIKFINTSEPDSLIIGYRQSNSGGPPGYEVAVRRRKGGCIVVVADAQHLAEFRKEIGPGRLIQEIGNQSGISYVVLQDTVGIILASRGVSEMSRIMSDPFLYSIFQRRSKGSRFLMYQGREVFEISGAFSLDNSYPSVFRIGLETARYRTILRNARLRLIFIVLIFVLIGIIGMSFIVVNQNVKLLSESYTRVKTHTGEILQKMKDAVIAADSTGKIIVFNEAAETLFGISKKHIIGRSVSLFNIPPFPILKESLDNGKPIEKTREKVLIQDHWKILSLGTSILRDKENNIDTVILVATDLTMQTHLEERLRQQEKFNALGKLASGVAHEIRNPINAIGMIAQRFLKEFKPKRDQEEYEKLAKTIVQETKRSSEIIQRFLQFAKPAPLNITRVSTEKLLNQIGTIVKSGAESRGIKLDIDVKDNIYLEIDNDQMKQALLNLVQNSIDATPPGGQITIRGRIEGNYYVISVSDTGSGISDNDKDRIFDLYYTTKKHGTGMGLAIVYQIIQNHKGTIEFETFPGQGTTFFIRMALEEQT